MKGTIKNRLKESIQKNAPEAKAYFTGHMPSFVTKVGRPDSLSNVPVFVFHEVEPNHLNKQLLYLQVNHYRTLDADELEEAARKGIGGRREIGITFDDATWTFWAYAFPLLKKYGFQAIVFAIPGLVPNDSALYPNIEDVWEGTCSLGDLEQRRDIQPLCTWRELAIMHQSGLVDIQSHSLTHARVPVSPRLIDFFHPGFDSYFFANINVPISSLDDPKHPERKFRLGAPVFKSASRMAGRIRFREAPELVEGMMSYVEHHGAETFFAHRNWEKKLTAVLRQWPSEKMGRFETPEEMESAVRWELVESKKILEERLSKKVHHFCYPWFSGSGLVDHLAAEAGYRTLHYGIDVNGQTEAGETVPLRIRRISEDYLFRLPGKHRLPIRSIWISRLARFLSA